MNNDRRAAAGRLFCYLGIHPVARPLGNCKSREARIAKRPPMRTPQREGHAPTAVIDKEKPPTGTAVAVA